MNESLNQFKATKSAEAFRHIVASHIDGVHAQCVRRLRDRAMAEDVTQAVFVMLARQAHKVPTDAPLAGWLYVAARYACLNAIRSESRRRTHERKAATMRPETGGAGDETDHADLQASLDDALAKLAEGDRNAIVLRYLEDRPMAEVGQGLGVSEATARQRVSRALDRLRRRLAAMGVPVPAAGLPGVLTGVAAWPAPQGLLDATVQRALTSPGVTEIELIAKGACQMMAWTKIRMAAVWAVAVLTLAATGVAVLQAGGRPPADGGASVVHTPAAAAEAERVEIPAALEGEWVPTQAGIPVTITIRGTTLTFVTDNERTVLDIIRVDTSVEPHGIDGTIRENALRNREQDLPGTRYELAYMLGDDDLLRLALSPPGMPRATSVDPTVERKALVLKRKAPSTAPSTTAPAVR